MPFGKKGKIGRHDYGSFFRDLFTCWLDENGHRPELYQPAGMLGAPPLGWQIYLGESKFVYRVPPETPHWLIIVLFERRCGRLGLRSPFADIVRFLSTVKVAAVGITHIKGHVAATSDRPMDSLENERILTFYRRYLRVEDLVVENETLWVGGPLQPFVPPLAAERNRLVGQVES